MGREEHMFVGAVVDEVGYPSSSQLSHVSTPATMSKQQATLSKQRSTLSKQHSTLSK